MVAYCKAKQIEFDSVRFLHDGERLSPESTAASRKMKDGDVLQAFQEQQGGDGQTQDIEREEKINEHKKSKIRIKIESGDSTVTVKIGRTMLLGELIGNITNTYHQDEVC